MASTQSVSQRSKKARLHPTVWTLCGRLSRPQVTNVLALVLHFDLIKWKKDVEKSSFPLGQTLGEGKQGFVKVNEKAAARRWWIDDDDVWKGCVLGELFTCMQLELWFVCLYFMLSWIQNVVYPSYQIRFVLMHLIKKDVLVWEKAACVTCAFTYIKWLTTYIPTRTSGNLEFDSITAVSQRHALAISTHHF